MRSRGHLLRATLNVAVDLRESWPLPIATRTLAQSHVYRAIRHRIIQYACYLHRWSPQCWPYQQTPSPHAEGVSTSSGIVLTLQYLQRVEWPLPARPTSQRGGFLPEPEMRYL